MSYRVAVTADLNTPDGRRVFGDIGLDRLTEAGIDYEVFSEFTPQLTIEHLSGFNAVLLMGSSKVSAQTLRGLDGFRQVARFGAGYDSVDVDACTAAGVAVTNTPDAVRTPMAHASLTLLLACAHNLRMKDRLVRSGRWQDRVDWQGKGLQDATVGIIGFGGIGQETARLLNVFGSDVVAYNRSDKTREAATLGVRMLALNDVLEQADYVLLALAANPGTRHLIGKHEFRLMKRTAHLINVARGSVVDEAALIEALQSGEIAGAGLDVFDPEPLATDNPLVSMDNVVLAPHSLCWTDPFARAVATSAITDLISVSKGERPAHFVNPDAWKSGIFQ